MIMIMIMIMIVNVNQIEFDQTPEFGLIKVLALSGFDPPTPGLWAPCASSAPKRSLTLDAI